MERRQFLAKSAALAVSGGAVANLMSEFAVAETLGKAATSKESNALKGRYIEHLNWKEAEELMKVTPVALVPLGARAKEHGYHLPLNNDWIMAEYLTRRVLERKNVLAFPTVQYNYFPAFVEYPGSIHIRKETSRDMIVDIGRSIGRHLPSKKIYVLNTGISTFWALEPAREILRSEGITMEYTNLIDATGTLSKKLKKQKHGTHADELETSKMLYMAPEIVKMAAAEKNDRPDQKGPLTRKNDGSGLYSPNGVWGDPTLATLEKGKILTEAMIDHIIHSLDAFEKKDYSPRASRTKYL